MSLIKSACQHNGYNIMREMKMLRLMCLLAAIVATSSSASAETIGISKREVSNKFQDTIWKKIEDIGAITGLDLRSVSADMDSKRQLRQIEDLYASGVDGVVVALTSPKIADGIASIARKSHKPLVFVSTKPPVEVLGDNVVYIGTDARESGTLEMGEVCQRLKGAGTVTILMGDLSSSAARDRMTAMHEVLKSPTCGKIEVLEEQSAGWSRSQAREITRKWLSAGLKPDAIVSSNDEMALGAVDALKDAGVRGTLVSGIDATDEGLAAVQSGELAFTILQDGKQQGEMALTAINKISAGDKVPPVTWLSYKMVFSNQASQMIKDRTGS